MKTFNSVDEYINSYPKDVQDKLSSLRKTIKHAAPKAGEIISYGMPAYTLNGILVYFGGFKDHLSLFPTGSGVEAFKKELADYKTSKGTIQFSLDQKLPLPLITKIVKFRVKENTEK